MGIENSVPATFRGVPFAIESYINGKGRKISAHEYPYRRDDYLQDLGGKLNDLKINVIIFRTRSVEEYLAQKLAFEFVLDKEGAGFLSMPPPFKSMRAVVPDYNMVEDNTASGITRYYVEFKETAANIFPIIAGENVGAISDLVDSTIITLGAEIGTKFLSSSQNFNDTADKQAEITTHLQQPLPVPANANKESYNQFKNDLENFHDNRFEASKTGDGLSDNITTILQSYDNVAETQEYNYLLWKNLYDVYGTGDVSLKADTSYLRERESNRLLINSTVKGMALNYMFTSATQITYNDNEDLKAIQDELIERYNELSANNSFSESTWNNFENIKFKTFKFFSQLVVDEVVDTIISRHTLTTFLYDYYENFDKEDEIIKLNNIINPTILEGNIKMVTTNV